MRSPRLRIRVSAVAVPSLLGALLAMGGCGCGSDGPSYTPAPVVDVRVPCDGAEQIAVFDDSDVLDDQFDVFVDGRLVFRTPVGGGAVNDTCLAGFGPGVHSLRIVFVQDIDDPAGTDPDENGTYGIVLSNGVVFQDGPGVTSPTTATEDLFPPGAADVYSILVP